ncbi:TFIIIC subunit 5 family protein ASCRUDRAFT_17932, partial [Ascoidea rubescens DSM 1968]
LNLPHLASIEFPLNVRDVDRAISMVGGPGKIKRALINDDFLELRLRKNDPYHHPIQSQNVHRENILLKISLPKGELQNDNAHQYAKSTEICEVQRKYKAMPIAIVNKIYRFRELADFQYINRDSQYSKVIQESLFNGNFTKIKQLKLDTDKRPWLPNNFQLYSNEEILSNPVTKQQITNLNLDLPSLPRFSTIPLSFNYNYRKNPSAHIIKEESGKIKLINLNHAPRLHTIFVDWKTEIPDFPPQNLIENFEKIKKAVVNDQAEKPSHPLILNSDASFDRDLLLCIYFLKEKFEQKPIWLRKHLLVILPRKLKPLLKYGLPYVSFAVRKGPWRQSFVKFGVNPKSSSKYAKYQTESFRVLGFHEYEPAIDKEQRKIEQFSEVPRNYEFYGDEMPISLLFQIENIKDPLLVKIFKKEKLNNNVNLAFGWYNENVLLLVRNIMRYKLNCLVHGEAISQVRINKIIERAAISKEEKEKEKEKEKKKESIIQNQDEEGEKNNDKELQDTNIDNNY